MHFIKKQCSLTVTFKHEKGTIQGFTGVKNNDITTDGSKCK